MTALAYLLGVLLFAVGVAVSIGLHEMGHLIPGKLFNVKVTQFFVGFGRTLWSTRRGETEYGVKAIPLGGYCKLVGMLPPAADQDPTLVRDRKTGMFAQLMDDARSAEYEHVDPADQDRLFYSKPWWQRVVIMGSGRGHQPADRVLPLRRGVHGPRRPEGDHHHRRRLQVRHRRHEVQPRTSRSARARRATRSHRRWPRASSRGTGSCPSTAPRSRAGSRSSARSAPTAPRQATVVVERGGSEVTPDAEDGRLPAGRPGNPERITKAGFLGVVPTTENERQGLGFVVTTMADGTWQTVKAIGAMPVKLYHVARAAVGLEERDPNGPMSVVGAGRVAGEMASADQVSVSDRFFSVITLLAGLNLFLGLINLVPLPPFDGGGIATTLYEAIRRGFARLFHRPDPGAVDSAKLLPVTYVMAGLILLMSIVLIYADIVAPISLT